MPAILAKLRKQEFAESPFVNKILDTKAAVLRFVKPQLVANFEFATWTKTSRLRKPAIFLGFRSDKKNRQVVREISVEAQDIERKQEQERPSDFRWSLQAKG